MLNENVPSDVTTRVNEICAAIRALKVALNSGELSHTLLDDIGTNTHAQIDAHIVATHRNWYKIDNPDMGWLDSKVAGWTADQFTPGGLEVDFSAQVPVGVEAVRCLLYQEATPSGIYYRKSGDANISNTPSVSQEYSHYIMSLSENNAVAELWLSADYKVQFAVTNVDTDLYIAYPIEYYI